MLVLELVLVSILVLVLLHFLLITLMQICCLVNDKNICNIREVGSVVVSGVSSGVSIDKYFASNEYMILTICF